jgi:hypothetical protein
MTETDGVTNILDVYNYFTLSGKAGMITVWHNAADMVFRVTLHQNAK